MISPTIQTEIKKFYLAQPDFGNLPMQEIERLSEATRLKRCTGDSGFLTKVRSLAGDIF